jgi:uncharacterized protein involved in exopolysaccharide biosynthesis
MSDKRDLGSAELGLLELVESLWRSRWFILAAGLFGGALALAVALFTPKQYEAAIRMVPASDANGAGQLGNLAEVASQLVGLTSLTGVSMGANQAKQEAIATLESQVLTTQFIDRETLLPVLFARRWDSEKNAWKNAEQPTAWEANRLFRRSICEVTESAKTGVITLTITWRDPQKAADWANGLVKLANDYLRQQAIDESARNIAYLTKQAGETSVVGVQNAIYSLLEAEFKKQMIAKGRDQYALRVVDPASAPTRASSPRTLAWSFAAACLGAILAAGIVVVVRSYKVMAAHRLGNDSPK